MRQGLAFILIFMLLGLTFPGKEVQSEKDGYQTIPDDAIRLRILANSDNEEDQQVKHLVRDEVNSYINELVQYMNDIEEARETIRQHLPQIKEIVADTLKQLDDESDFDVEYGSNVSFPTKVYDRYVYPAGEYEAVLITIGEGKGANWWCVLFPPLCFLDFSGSTSVAEESEENIDEDIQETDEEDVEVSFFLLEWLGLS